MYPLIGGMHGSQDRSDWTASATKELTALARDARTELDTCYRRGIFPHDVYVQLGDMGYIGALAPQAYGGLGGGVPEYCVVSEEIGRHGLVQTQIAVQGQLWLLRWGSEDQRAQWLAPLVSGEKLFSESISEKNAGSSFKTMEATAVRDGGDWILRGSKTHVNLGADCDVTAFYAVSETGLTSFLVEMATPGIETVRTDPVGLRMIPTADVHFTDVRVPASALLGDPGDGMKTFLSTFNISRLGNASELIGLGRRALDTAIDYASRRRVADDLVTDFQGLQWAVADAWQGLAAAALARDHAALLHSAEADGALSTSLAKRLAIDAAEGALTAAHSLVGGHGLYLDTPYPKIANDVRVLKVAGGSSEVLRNHIARQVLRSRDHGQLK